MDTETGEIINGFEEEAQSEIDYIDDDEYKGIICDEMEDHKGICYRKCDIKTDETIRK